MNTIEACYQIYKDIEKMITEKMKHIRYDKSFRATVTKKVNNDIYKVSHQNNKSMGKYYGQIKPCGYDEVITLSYWDTPEKAFKEYKKIKQADILLMAAKYKNKIPKNVYEILEFQPN